MELFSVIILVIVKELLPLILPIILIEALFVLAGGHKGFILSFSNLDQFVQVDKLLGLVEGLLVLGLDSCCEGKGVGLALAFH